MEKETIEQAAKYYAHNYFVMQETNNYKALKQGFEAGAKWQQEQDKNKYSEEEVRELFKQYKEEFSIYRNLQILNIQFEDWFEQVKKK
jgi:hypothetical protein